jgi:hypothetical protein
MKSFVIKERNRRIIRRITKEFNLDLEGLTVFTEASTGNYLYMPIIAGLAGAKYVYAFTTDSKYGTKEKVKEQTLEEAHKFRLHNINVLFKKERDCIHNSDIITNSGFVRPITKRMISYMKPTAVIPLMRLGNEFRKKELDLEACNERGIVVLGTDEKHPKLDLLASSGFKICKILFERGFSVFGDKLLLIGSGDVCNYPMEFFVRNKISVDRVTFDYNFSEKQRTFWNNISQTRENACSHEQVLKNLNSYDALIINEIYHNVDILSDKGFIPVKLLKKKNPYIQIIHLAGSINKSDILREGLCLYPEDIAPFGYMSISSDYLGLRCTTLLTVASLKVAEVAVRCRLKGMSVMETVEYTLKNSPAMLVEGSD